MQNHGIKFLNWKKIDTKKEKTLHATNKKTNSS